MKIQLNDKKSLRLLRQKIEAALAPFSEESGLKFSIGSIRYEGDGTGCKMQLEARAPDASGTVKEKHTQDFERYWQMFEGLKLEHLGSKVKLKDGIAVVIGLKPNARRFPVLVERTDGKRFRMPVSSLKIVE